MLIMIVNGCVTSNRIAWKSGAELWAENCVRCHNTPPPNSFTDKQWNKIGVHMKIRAYLTDDEQKKIIEFLQSAN